MSACACMPRRMRCLKPEGSESVKMRFSTATRKYFIPIVVASADAIPLQMSMSALFRQDCTDGRQGGGVQLELFDGRAKCKGVERGRCDSAAVGDASYVDVRLVVDIVYSGDNMFRHCPSSQWSSWSLSVSGDFVSMLATGFVIVQSQRAIRLRQT
jgi:hypothetical protein